MTHVQFTLVDATSPNSVKQRFVNMINRFKQDYFDDNDGANRATIAHLMIPTTVTRAIVIYNNREIGCVEFSLHANLLGINTVYIKPQFRGQNMSKLIYDNLENYANECGLWFYIEVEERKFGANPKKFFDMGFTHFFRLIPQTQAYLETAYALFRKPHSINMLPTWLPDTCQF